MIRALDSVVLATLTGNGLNGPKQAAFNGEWVMVTNETGPSVSLGPVASDFAPLGRFDTGGAR